MKARSPGRMALRRFLRNGRAVAGAAGLGVMLGAALIVPEISPHPFDRQYLKELRARKIAARDRGAAELAELCRSLPEAAAGLLSNEAARVADPETAGRLARLRSDVDPETPPEWKESFESYRQRFVDLVARWKEREHREAAETELRRLCRACPWGSLGLVELALAQAKRANERDVIRRLEKIRAGIDLRLPATWKGSAEEFRVRFAAVEKKLWVSYPPAPPDATFLFGTDGNGRDLMTRTFLGGRTSFLIAFVASGITVLIGVLYGATAGFCGGWVDRLMMRVVDVLYGLPYMLLVIVIMALFKTRDMWVVFVVLGLVGWLTLARIVRGQILMLKEAPFVEAARALGVRGFAIVGKHLIPNTLGPVIVYATLSIPSLILSESFLSFLGLGVSEPNTSWGVLISEGARSLSSVKSDWWLVTFPGACLAITLYCLNSVGDGLRDAFDVRTGKS